jgi:small subunit ribosomal protein S16
MLTIRFNRTGKKNHAQFRVVVQEHTVAPGGRHVEVLGSYDPHQKKAVLKAERITYWLGQGAQMSDSAFNLCVKEGVVKADKKRAVKIARSVKAAEETPAPATEVKA